MVYYISSDKNTELITPICEEMGMVETIISDVSDINEFIAENMLKMQKNEKSITHLCVDISALTNNNYSEIADGIMSIRSGCRISVVIIAPGFADNNPLIVRLFRNGIYNIASDSENLEMELRECLSPGGRQYKDVVKFAAAEEDEEQNKKPGVSVKLFPALGGGTERRQETKVVVREVVREQVKVQSGKTTIGICGTHRHIGTTHHGVALTKFLNIRGEKACYIESNSNSIIRPLQNMYEVKAEDEGMYICDGVHMFTKDVTFDRVLDRDYDYFIFDYGEWNEIRPENYFTRDVKIVVSGAKPWEFQRLEEILKNVQNIKPLFNFTPNDHKDFYKSVGEKLGVGVYFADYAPCFLLNDTENNNNRVYEELIGSYLHTGTLKVSNEKRGLGKILGLF